ncbi:MAG: DUF2061 domain-containing protein [Pseudomonadota bacterium]
MNESFQPYQRDLAKTFSFLALHFVVGFTVAYAFTGEVGISSAIALVEPLVNAVVFFFHERSWRRDFSWFDLLVHRCAPESEFGPRVDASDEPGGGFNRGFDLGARPYRRDLGKTFSFLSLHFIVGFTVAYLFTGEIAIASAIALFEPLANAVVFFFHERAWRGQFSFSDFLERRASPESEFAPTEEEVKEVRKEVRKEMRRAAQSTKGTPTPTPTPT